MGSLACSRLLYSFYSTVCGDVSHYELTVVGTPRPRTLISPSHARAPGGSSGSNGSSGSSGSNGWPSLPGLIVRVVVGVGALGFQVFASDHMDWSSTSRLQPGQIPKYLQAARPISDSERGSGGFKVDMAAECSRKCAVERPPDWNC